MDITKFQEESDLEFEARKLNAVGTKEALDVKAEELLEGDKLKVKLPSKLAIKQ